MIGVVDLRIRDGNAGGWGVGRAVAGDEWRAWFVAGIRHGLDDIDAGRAIGHEATKQEIEDSLASLEETGR